MSALVGLRWAPGLHASVAGDRSRVPSRKRRQFLNGRDLGAGLERVHEPAALTAARIEVHKVLRRWRMHRRAVSLACDLVSVLAAAGLLRDQPAETEYSVLGPDDRPGVRVELADPYDALGFAEKFGGKAERREVGPWRPVEAGTEGKSDG